MKILFEEYIYRTSDISPILSERYYLPVDSTRSKINYVGYYYNPNLDNGRGESIIILPKVFLDSKNKTFDGFEPQDFVEENKSIHAYNYIKKSGKNKIVFEITTWIYKSIQQFNKRQKLNQISERNFLNQVISNLDENDSSELDIILSLIHFYKNHHTLITFVAKLSHSQQNKINWQKTINKKLPYIQNSQPYYIDLVSKNKNVKLDEELIVLYFSTLNYIKTKYSFDIQIPERYEIISGKKFQSLLNNGTRYLKKIKYKYFQDNFIDLWKLLYTFFERSEKIHSKNQVEEILLIKDFNIIFEDMIDDLIGDTNLIPDLKNHPDGKQLDHIYKYQSLLSDDNIYFVGDSKYYKPNTILGKNSKAKQFSYAKNVIQYCIDLFRSNKLDSSIKYRDECTEGYNITPNFFISAFVDEDFNFTQSKMISKGKPILQSHFSNRLFDRDTLFVQSYEINFLFVLSAYISKNSSLKLNFKSKTRKDFRDRLINFLQESYDFYKLTFDKGKSQDAFIKENFKILNGKIYKPSYFSDNIILALEKNFEKTEILNSIEPDVSVIIYILH